MDGEDKQIKKEIEKEKPRKTERNTLTESSGSVPESNMPAYIPYHLYAPLLDRVRIMIIVSFFFFNINEKNLFYSDRRSGRKTDYSSA